MRWSKLFIPTLREPTLREAPGGIPTDGGRLLTRDGYIRGDTHLFLGKRSLDRIARAIREELAALDAQEFSSRKTPMGLAARELRSYKQLPQVWYQVREEFEARSFGVTPLDLLDTARAILRRCGIECLEARGFDGTVLVIPHATGELEVVRAESYFATLESAVSEPKPPAAPDPEGDLSPEPFHTPNRKTIAELADFTGLPETSHIKSLVMVADGSLFMALLRGDHQLSETKLGAVLRTANVRPAQSEDIRRHFAANAGSLGPVGVTGVRILADEALRGRRNMIAGANRDDYHLRHVTPGEDFAAEFFDLRQAAEGDTWNGEVLRIEKAVVLASLSRQVPAADLHVTDETGKEVPLCVGSCNMSLERILWAVAEQHHDSDGLILPPEIAAFDLIVTPVDFSSQAQREAAERLAEAAGAMGIEVLVDDRDERPGVKFKDADLVGIPWRVTIGKKLGQGIVEVVERRSKQKTDVAVDQAIEFIRTRRL